MSEFKIRLLTNLGSNDYPDCPWIEGDVKEVPTECSQTVAAKLLNHGHASIVPVEPAPAKVDRFEEMRSQNKPVTANQPKQPKDR